jgi:hypothetical protein
MDVTQQHLATFLDQSVFGYRVDSVELRYVDSQLGQDVVLDLRAGYATGIEEMELLFRLFKSTDMVIPAWENVSAGCDTCGHGSLSLLDGLTIKNVCSLGETLAEAAMIRWEQDLDRLERERLQKIQQEQARRDRERRKQVHLAEQSRQRKLKEQQEKLYKNNIDEVFEGLWAIYEPLLAMKLKGKEFHERTLSLPHVIRKLFFGFRKTKPEHQNYAGIKHRFMDRCEKSPKHMMKALFPNGEQLSLNYRCIRWQTDQKMREKQRQLEAEGYIIF